MAICGVPMTVENRRDCAAIAMLIHMILVGAGAMLIYTFFAVKVILYSELNGLLQKHYDASYTQFMWVLGVSMIVVHGYGIKVG